MRSTTIVTRLTEHDDVIKSLLRGDPRPGLALGPASARAGPDHDMSLVQTTNTGYWRNFGCFRVFFVPFGTTLHVYFTSGMILLLK